jgi:cell division septal protein FtsQ
VRRRRRRSSLLPWPALRSLRRPLRPVKGAAWFRGGSLQRPRRGVDRGSRWRRLLAGGLALAELSLLVVVLAHPAFRVQHVDVTGTHRLAASEVVARAGLSNPGSIFTVNPSGVSGRLKRSTWVRSSTVSESLPDRVLVRVEEWQPVAVYQSSNGHPYFLSEEAVALGPAGGPEASAGLLLVQGPQTADPKPGQRVLDSRLLVALVNIQRTLPRLIGQDVRGFSIDGCGNLTLVSVRGWSVQFGRMLTGEEIATLGDKVSALRAVAPDIDYNSPDLQAVNVMNPAAVAVRVKSKPTPGPARASPSPSSSPNSRTGPVRIQASAAASPAPATPVEACR